MKPLSSTSSSCRKAATASSRPEPHRLRAAPPPMTWTRRAPSDTVTASMAPGTAPLPQEMPTPSKAGPAAVAQQ